MTWKTLKIIDFQRILFIGVILCVAISVFKNPLSVLPREYKNTAQNENIVRNFEEKTSSFIPNSYQSNTKVSKINKIVKPYIDYATSTTGLIFIYLVSIGIFIRAVRILTISLDKNENSFLSAWPVLLAFPSLTLFQPLQLLGISFTLLGISWFVQRISNRIYPSWEIIGLISILVSLLDKTSFAMWTFFLVSMFLTYPGLKLFFQILIGLIPGLGIALLAFNLKVGTQELSLSYFSFSQYFNFLLTILPINNTSNGFAFLSKDHIGALNKLIAIITLVLTAYGFCISIVARQRSLLSFFTWFLGALILTSPGVLFEISYSKKTIMLFFTIICVFQAVPYDTRAFLTKTINNSKTKDIINWIGNTFITFIFLVQFFVKMQ
jgi:hypothetical protein